MRFVLICIAGVLAGCNDRPPPSCAGAKEVVFALTPAPAGETPLERWKRTKADYIRATKLDEQKDHSFALDAIMPYMDAEDALVKADCKIICPPPAKP